jgi:hypothetical protein
MTLAAITVITWIAVVCGLSFVVLLVIILSPWPRLDHESRRLDDDVETRLLLREDPDELADELDAEEGARPPVAEFRRDERR